MKPVLALALVLAACGGPRPKPESPIVNEGSDTSENCCCKSTPPSGDEDKPLYEMLNRMECSAKQGACVPDVQCKKTGPE